MSVRACKATALIMGIITAIASLFGCAESAEYTVNELTLLSISCGSMSRDDSYSFTLERIADGWSFSADCFINDSEASVVSCPIQSSEAEELLSIVRERGFIDRLRRYKKPWRPGSVSDEAMYGAHMRFTDENTISGALRPDDGIVSCFYRLAEKYAAPAAE